MKIEPLNDCVVVELLKPDKAVTKGGILMPDEAADRYEAQRGRVVAVGPGNWGFHGERLKVELDEGDIVVLHHGVTPLRIGDFELAFVRDRDILAVVRRRAFEEPADWPP